MATEDAPEGVRTGFTIIPVLPCVSLDETVTFYRALGFEVTREQTTPYFWGEVRRDGIEIHFTRIKGHDPSVTSNLCLVMVDEVRKLHAGFVEQLRKSYGRLPVAGLPRISRGRSGMTRIKAVDPAGNAILFIQRDEAPPDYEGDPEESASWSPLAQALQMAVWLRDLRGHDDAAAARVLDVALARHPPSPTLDYARVVAARAELAVALGDMDRFRALSADLRQAPLTDEEREEYREEFEAAVELGRLVADA